MIQKMGSVLLYYNLDIETSFPIKSGNLDPPVYI
jgi:hypothetical protein